MVHQRWAVEPMNMATATSSPTKPGRFRFSIASILKAMAAIGFAIAFVVSERLPEDEAFILTTWFLGTAWGIALFRQRPLRLAMAATIPTGVVVALTQSLLRDPLERDTIGMLEHVVTPTV